MKKVVQVSAVVFIGIILAAPYQAMALNITIPTVSISPVTITRIGSGGSSIGSSFGRRTQPAEENQDDNQNTSTQGTDGEDGASGSESGTVRTGDENTEVNVVNNGPTSDAISGSGSGFGNGGVTAPSGANGGNGGRSRRGGSVSTGGTITSASSLNNINQSLFLSSTPGFSNR